MKSKRVYLILATFFLVATLLSCIFGFVWNAALDAFLTGFCLAIGYRRRDIFTTIERRDSSGKNIVSTIHQKESSVG